MLRLSKILKNRLPYGVKQVEKPREALTCLYKEILEAVKTLPSTSYYAQSVIKHTTERLAIVSNTVDVELIQDTINAGLMEDLIQQAKDELLLIPFLLNDRVFDPLETSPPVGQWDVYSPRAV